MELQKRRDGLCLVAEQERSIAGTSTTASASSKSTQRENWRLNKFWAFSLIAPWPTQPSSYGWTGLVFFDGYLSFVEEIS